MKEVADQTDELFQSLQPKDWFNELSPDSWFTSLLRSLGLTGWGAWLMRVGLMLLGGFIFLMIAVAITCCMITQALSSLSSLFSPSARYIEITTQ